MNPKFEASGAATPWEPIPTEAGTSKFPIATDRGTKPYRLSKWRGEPGTYERPKGMPWSETYVVFKGRGRLRTESEDFELAPGVVVDIRKGVPYTMVIEEAIEKFAIVTLET
jgi:quercetin dioxygenase-like cupin family protein